MSARTRRIAGAVAAAMAGLAVLIAVLPFIWDPQDPPELAAPMLVPRPVLSAILLAVPAAIAFIAVIRKSTLMLVVAGLLTFLQSFVAFSGVTLGFLLPALLLIVLGVREEDRSRASRRQKVTGVLVIGLVVAAWLVVLGTGETVCWIARLGPDGTPIYRLIPVTDTIMVAPSEVGGGCDSGVPTAAGLLTGGVLILGALALAWLASAVERPVVQMTD
jgi:hypothetical protein